MVLLVLFEIAVVALMCTLPFVELSVDSKVRFFEVLLLIALKGSGRIHEIIGRIELRQILPISILIDTILLIPLSLLRIVQFIRQNKIDQNKEQSSEVQQFEQIIGIEVDGRVPDDVADYVD